MNTDLEDGTTAWMGVDDRGHLYWNGEPVVTEQRVKLAGWVNFAIIAGGLSTVVTAALSLLAFLGVGPAVGH
jgi:hypothetical protein